MTDNDLTTISNFVLAGTLGGGTLGLIRAIQKHNKLLKEQATQYERMEDPDTEKRAQDFLHFAKKAESMGALAGGLGIAGGLSGGVLAYKAVDHLARELRKKEIERLLQDAEEGYTDALLREAESMKAAFAKEGAWRLPNQRELAMSMLIAALPLAALGSGAFSYRMLDRSFAPDPAGNSPGTLRMTDLPAVRAQRIKERAEEEDGARKEASAEPFLSDAEEAFCFTLGVVTSFAKAASLRGFVKAVALGRGPELEKVAAEQGMETALAVTKGADRLPVDGRAFDVALMRIVKTAAWMPVIKLLTIAEMVEHCPTQMKIASLLPTQAQDECIRAAVYQHKLARAVAFDAVEAAADMAPVPEWQSHEMLACFDRACKSASALPRNSAIPMYDTQGSRPSEDSKPGRESTERIAQPPQDLIDMAFAQTKEVHGMENEKPAPVEASMS